MVFTDLLNFQWITMLTVRTRLLHTVILHYILSSSPCILVDMLLMLSQSFWIILRPVISVQQQGHCRTEEIIGQLSAPSLSLTGPHHTHCWTRPTLPWPLLVSLNDLTTGWQNQNPLSHLNATLAPQARASGKNLNYVTIAPQAQARPTGEILNYLLSR